MNAQQDLIIEYTRINKTITLFVRLVIAVLSITLLVTFASFAHAGAEPDMNAVTRGTAWLQHDNGVYIEALQLESDVSINVSGMIARARVRQQFKNTSSLWAEGLYVFPLPDNAAVDHFKLMIDGRVIEGQIQEKEQARKTYQQARNNGQRAGLIEQQRPNIFSTRLANISPGAEMEVEIEYQQTLQYRDGEYTLRYPLVVGERFITPSRAGLSDPQYDVGVFSLSSETSNQLNPVSISINLDNGVPVTHIASSSHAVIIDPQPDNHYVIRLRDKTVPADRDFILSWTPELGQLPKAAVFNQHYDGYDYSLITVYPPRDELYNRLDIPRDVVFILDVSGSMSGTSIDQAKSALMLALNRLKPSDKFNIIWFNNMSKKMHYRSKYASNDNINEARRFVSSLSADGGTVMLPALKLALESESDPSFLRQTIFITDGNVSNERDLFSYIKSHLDDNRLFTVGIGSAPNNFFMKKAAQAGRGTYTFISDIREVGKKTEALFRRLESPALTDISMKVIGDDIEHYSNPIPDLYIGEPVTVLLRGKNIYKDITIKGYIGTTPWQSKVSLNTASFNDGVRVAWAREKIAALTQAHYDEDQGNMKDHMKMQIIEESIRHNLVSRFTSLVAVDVTPVNQSGQLHSELIKNNLPHGWARSGTQASKINLPQTATGAYQHLIYALLLFTTMALMLRFMRLTHDY
ncbi:MAG: marine proteobacterial sortase target protein [Gammaproteobacteria bacterium]|nr:marine proteobacterial sortase target protein [Gammaproteobacteria bacterium]